MPELSLIPRAEFERVLRADLDTADRLGLLADMCRLNALVAVKRAGSGHLGSSFSAMDVVVHLLYEELNTRQIGFDDPNRDVYFSSKGHDVPGLYAVLNALGVIPTEQLLRLRRLGGLDGHPDLRVPGIEANSGSLGMGISKGRGMAWAKTLLGRGGRVVVMTGDGELQEGQNFEALQAAAAHGTTNLWVVVDRNELQSDRPTEEILSLGDLDAKLRSFGWHVESCDGHDHTRFAACSWSSVSAGDGPKALVANTIKGNGVSFMEHPAAFGKAEEPTAGMPALPTTTPSSARTPSLWRASASGCQTSSSRRPRSRTRSASTASWASQSRERGRVSRSRTSTSPTRTARSCSSWRMSTRSSSCSTQTSPRIAVSARSSSRIRTASTSRGSPSRTWCRPQQGWPGRGFCRWSTRLPSFLASRANEQIYNQASERTKVVYALHYAGLIPAGPGKSHQSLRDVSLLAALPNMTVVQPANSEETRALLRWAVEEASENVAIRLAIGPSPRAIELPRSSPRRDGAPSCAKARDALLFAYGP